MDPESSKGKAGKHQDLEQGDRQRPQRTEKKKTNQAQMVRRSPFKTLQDGIDGFLDSKRSLAEFTLTNYRRQLQNQGTDDIPAKTPLWQLEWDRVGREKVKQLVALSKREAVTVSYTHLTLPTKVSV